MLPLDGMALEMSGQVGDYLAADGSGWRVIPARPDAATLALGKLAAMRGLIPHLDALAAGLRAVLQTYRLG